MKQIEIKASGDIDLFIGGWFIEPPSICDDIVEFFNINPKMHKLGQMQGGINLESKNSTDLSIDPGDVESPDYAPIKEYLNQLYRCLQEYSKQWPFFKTAIPRLDVSTFNIQRYGAGGHFNAVHSERTSLAHSYRVLAWMTYLNDVENGGATSFVHQNIDIQPQKAKTLIWPAEWTHAHKGNVVTSGEKYIITGWFHFPHH